MYYLEWLRKRTDRKRNMASFRLKEIACDEKKKSKEVSNGPSNDSMDKLLLLLPVHTVSRI